MNEFNAFEYISAARNHFSMPRAETDQLTMTEFQQLLAAKYPEQKGFTREEYDQMMDEDEKRWQAMMETQKKSIAHKRNVGRSERRRFTPYWDTMELSGASQLNLKQSKVIEGKQKRIVDVERSPLR